MFEPILHLFHNLNHPLPPILYHITLGSHFNLPFILYLHYTTLVPTLQHFIHLIVPYFNLFLHPVDYFPMFTPLWIYTIFGFTFPFFHHIGNIFKFILKQIDNENVKCFNLICA